MCLYFCKFSQSVQNIERLKHYSPTLIFSLFFRSPPKLYILVADQDDYSGLVYLNCKFL